MQRRWQRRLRRLARAAVPQPAVLVVAPALCALMGGLPSVAGAQACPNEQLRAENGSKRLPDCRAYELVSPVEKNGAEAGGDNEESPFYSVASTDGSAVVYGTTGAIGDTTSGLDVYSVSRRSTASWSTGAALPRGRGELSFSRTTPFLFDPSTDMSHFLFATSGSFVPREPEGENSQSIYLAMGDESLAWVGEPRIPNPDPPLGEEHEQMYPAGGSSDLTTAYFTYYGTLVTSDAAREKNVASNHAWGLYEWREGHLTAAGELPRGSKYAASPSDPFDAFGAVPAAIGEDQNNTAGPDNFANEVSNNGSRAFFVSPDPRSEHPGEDIPELYVRENGERTVLVSEDALEGGRPSADGPLAVEDTAREAFFPYVYASPDGSHAFFESMGRLAKSATGKEPNGPGPWTYDFNSVANTLTYLPGVLGPIIASSEDGSWFVFKNTVGEGEGEGEEPKLDLWTRDSEDGTVDAITRLPKPASTSTNNGGRLYVDPARVVATGEELVFETDSALPGGFNDAGGYDQVYRYDLKTRELTCVSCPPSGVTPSGDARLSEDDSQNGNDNGVGHGSFVGSRGVSANGSRIFFDTPDPLAPQDINDKRDVYEWENGQVQLISSGTSPNESFFLDNSESGEDVFFATTDGLVGADTDDSYDVYDARVDGGFPAAVPPSPCLSDCQGPPSSPPTFGMPSSVTFSGEGNVAPPASKPPSKSGKPKAKGNPRKARKHKTKKRGSHRGRRASRTAGRARR